MDVEEACRRRATARLRLKQASIEAPAEHSDFHDGYTPIRIRHAAHLRTEPTRRFDIVVRALCSRDIAVTVYDWEP